MGKKKHLTLCAKISVGVALLYAVCAVVFINSSWIQRELIYVNRIKVPYFVNLSSPDQFGLHQAKHFFLSHDDECRIGVWYIPQANCTSTGSAVTDCLQDGRPIVLYLHGNTGTRGLSARVGLYEYLSQEKGLHVLTFDYRGFGDSTCYPSETNIMKDGLLVWNWIRERSPSHSKIYLWGHSLGSGAATHLAEYLQSHDSVHPAGVILDAPFTDIKEAAYYHPFGLPFRILGERYYQGMMETHSSIERVSRINSSIVILHGKSDIIIPYHLGWKLYQAALSSRKSGLVTGKVSFIDCNSRNHRLNYLAMELRESIDEFIYI